MHQSFVITATRPRPPPTYGQGRVGDSQADCPRSAGEMTGNTILNQGRFSIEKGRAKSSVLTSSLSPGGGGLVHKQKKDNGSRYFKTKQMQPVTKVVVIPCDAPASFES